MNWGGGVITATVSSCIMCDMFWLWLKAVVYLYKTLLQRALAYSRVTFQMIEMSVLQYVPCIDHIYTVFIKTNKCT